MQEQHVRTAIGSQQISARYRVSKLYVVDSRQRILEFRAPSPIAYYRKVRTALRGMCQTRQDRVQTLPFPDIAGVQYSNGSIAGHLSACQRGVLQKLVINAVHEETEGPARVSLMEIVI